MVTLTVNGARRTTNADLEAPLLWVLRDEFGLKGTKYGCGIGACGICVVHVDGEPVHACTTPLSDAADRTVTTIEGLASNPDHPVLRAWSAEQVPQCGYCQPGMIMAAAALLARNPVPGDAAIDEAMSGVLCRCGTYRRVRRALHRASRERERPRSSGVRPRRREPPGPPVFSPNPWVRVHEDGTVTVVIDKAEMGQGVTTALAMLVAEELEVDLDEVRTVFAPADPAYAHPSYGAQFTAGSDSVRSSWEHLRRAGAEAREMLVAAAAKTWGVATKECRAEHGMVLHLPSNKRLRYGEIAQAASGMRRPRRVRLKEPAAFRLVGTPAPRLEIPSFLDGTAVYGMDVARPGMLIAAVARPPVFGATVARVDARRTEKVAGVRRVVEIDAGVAVVAESFPAALAGREALAIDWNVGPNAKLNGATIRRRLERATRRKGRVARRKGNVESAFRKAERVIEAVYETPYLAHATMEPMNCTAAVHTDGCDVWVPTQAQTEAQEAAARAAGLAPEAVRIHTTFLGGGFGRRLEQDFVTEAVAIAKAVGRPVKVMWTREDDLRHDFYRPASTTLVRAVLDGRGRPTAWFQRIAGPPLAHDGVDVPYAIPNIREEHVDEDPGVPTGPWRSVGASQNAFVVEGFVDELAHAAGVDPFLYRRDLLSAHPRHRRALEVAAERADWGRPLAGRHRGIAFYHSFGSSVAEVAEVSVSQAGEIRVHRVVCAIDCGFAVNPDTVAAQVEGAVVFGLTAALWGEITIARGGVIESSFRDYPLLTLREMPEVEVHIVPSTAPPSGAGEPGLPPIAPAVANAVFAATGRRVRSLPLRAADLR